MAHSAVKQVALPKNYSTKEDEHFTPPSSPKASRKDSKSKLTLGLPADLESDSNSNDKKHQGGCTSIIKMFPKNCDKICINLWICKQFISDQGTEILLNFKIRNNIH